MKSKLFLVILVAVLAITGLYYFTNKQNNKNQHHEETHDSESIKLSPELISEFGIEISEAKAASLKSQINLPGEIKINADRQAHIVNFLPGVVSNVYKDLGDKVFTGEVMATLNSGELARLHEEYHEASNSLEIAISNFKREKALFEERITTEPEYLDAKLKMVQAEHELHAIEQELTTLGFSEDYIEKLEALSESDYRNYPILAPFTGTVVEKHLSIGENLDKDSSLFVVADLNSVWVDLSVYQKDLPYVKEGQKALINLAEGIAEVEGSISYVGPIVGEETRTAIARVVLANKSGDLRPGLFINAKILIDSTREGLLIPSSAIQVINDKDIIFIQTEEGFVPRDVELGQSTGNNIEIISGLRVGEKYVSKGSFTLKSEMMKDEFSGEDEH